MTMEYRDHGHFDKTCGYWMSMLDAASARPVWNREGMRGAHAGGSGETPRVPPATSAFGDGFLAPDP
jgi:hypothetical protein